MNTTQMPQSLPHTNTGHQPHVVQLYDEDRFLIDELTQFISAALMGGSSAVVIATKGHEDSLAQKMKDQGLDLARIIASGRYVALDAAETLTRIMVGGLPDTERFSEVIGGVLARAASAAQDQNRRVVAFGEMVSLLWAEGKTEGAIHLEKLWNQLARAYSFSLRCAYPMQGFCWRREDADSAGEDLRRSIQQSFRKRASESVRQKKIAGAAYVRLQQRMRGSSGRGRIAPQGRAIPVIRGSSPGLRHLHAGPRRTRQHLEHGSGGESRGYKAAGELLASTSPSTRRRTYYRSKPNKLLKQATQEGHAEDEGWRVRKDGAKFWASVTIAAVRNQAGQLIAFGKVTRDLTERRRAEIALRRSEDRFRLMAEAVQDYAIASARPRGYINTWRRPRAKRIKGYQATEIIGCHFSCFYPEKNIRAGKPGRDLQVIPWNRGMRSRTKGMARSARTVLEYSGPNVTSSPPNSRQANKLIGFAKVTRDVTDAMRKEKSLRDLASHLLQLQDEERRRIGRDLHDTLGQCVTAMKIGLDSLAYSVTPSNPVDQRKG